MFSCSTFFCADGWRLFLPCNEKGGDVPHKMLANFQHSRDDWSRLTE